MLGEKGVGVWYEPDKNSKTEREDTYYCSYACPSRKIQPMWIILMVWRLIAQALILMYFVNLYYDLCLRMSSNYGKCFYSIL